MANPACGLLRRDIFAQYVRTLPPYGRNRERRRQMNPKPARSYKNIQNPPGITKISKTRQELQKYMVVVGVERKMVVVGVVDSHIQRNVLATEETTVT